MPVKEWNDAEFSDATKKNLLFLGLTTAGEVINSVKKRVQSFFENNKAKNDLLEQLILCIDLTTLNAIDTDAAVRWLINKALQPYPACPNIKCAAVCVYPARIAGAKHYFRSKQQSLPLCSVAAGFPSGQYRMETKLLEVQLAVSDGADEFDIALSTDAVMEKDWKRVYYEVAELKSACSSKCMKTILTVGRLQLRNWENIYCATWAAMLAGTNFIKTSFENEMVIDERIEAAYVVCHAIKRFHSVTGIKVGFKVADDISSLRDALAYRNLVEEVLGAKWCTPNLFRIGANSLVDSIIEELIKMKNSKH